MDFEEATQQAFERGGSTWPGISLDQAAFRAWLDDHRIGLEQLANCGADLYLACACAAFDRQAIALFEEAFLAGLGGSIGRYTLTDQQSRDLRQELRSGLLATPGGGVDGYRGEGPLSAWVHVCALRAALSIKRATDNRIDAVKALDDLVARDANPELMVAKAQHREAFRAALHDCFADLPPREKTLLKMHFLDEMTIDEMGVLLRVHRSTVARWLVAIRHRVLEQVCAKVMLRINASASEMRSIMRLVRSDVSLSLHRILGDRVLSPDELK